MRVFSSITIRSPQRRGLWQRGRRSALKKNIYFCCGRLLGSFYPNNSTLSRWLDQRHGSNIRRAIILANIMFKGKRDLRRIIRRNDSGNERLGYSCEKHPNILPAWDDSQEFQYAGTSHPERIEIGLVAFDSWVIIIRYPVRCGGPVKRPHGISRIIFIVTSVNLTSVQVLPTTTSV